MPSIADVEFEKIDYNKMVHQLFIKAYDPIKKMGGTIRYPGTIWD